ncbi:hypothetical protein J3Q64DRAFT_1750330 [Phycomyces blakesleeanus]|uniref:Uncharacterized protein n=2 Tax=Phycomyces blakesleeanus TaxID=4837 RepID=A0A167PLA6_PHYB8|nr:hypothetical protein PHYBLDRAFT_140262 [Phycomyces blakesleeanus NRRL 1555(-)]OAD78159.1 hypothetical protein PHYBLDRAFT_140262 [Phycomyces blakesleeanus NRRL 1555(-)]|eukprot:XP_018296199.1 hypothetical protein PHYBLDRAFT_140262 [Phycomyces blakesleeanus NRRL 1555(-)]
MSQDSQSTQLVLQYLSQGYVYVYDNLKGSITILPEPERVFYYLSMITNAFITHSPAALRQFNALFQTLPEQLNPLTIFLGLILLYIIYCVFMTTARWAYGIVSGVVKMSLVMAIVGVLGYLAQVYTTDGMEGVVNALQEFTKRT